MFFMKQSNVLYPSVIGLQQILFCQCEIINNYTSNMPARAHLLSRWQQLENSGNKCTRETKTQLDPKISISNDTVTFHLSLVLPLKRSNSGKSAGSSFNLLHVKNLPRAFRMLHLTKVLLLLTKMIEHQIKAEINRKCGYWNQKLIIKCTDESPNLSIPCKMWLRICCIRTSLCVWSSG